MRCSLSRLSRLLAGRAVVLAVLAILALLVVGSVLPSAHAQIVTEARPASGVAGSTVRITGQGFSGSSDVVFGGASASIVDVNDAGTQLVVAVPEGLRGQVPVTVSGAEAPDPFVVVQGGTTNWGESAAFVDGENANPSIAAFADINNDGILDLVLGLPGITTLRWLQGDGNGGFGTGRDIDSGFQHPIDLTLADFVNAQNTGLPGDGLPDLLTGGGNYSVESSNTTGSQKMRLFVTNAGDSFSGQDIGDENQVGDVRAVASGDLDGDGDLDAVSVSSDESDSQKSVTLHRNDDDASSFTDTIIDETGSAPSDPRDVALADVDGDGDLDVVVADHTSGGAILVFRNEGDGTFPTLPEAIRSDVNDPIDVDVTDFNADGLPDLLVAAESGGNAFALLNEGGSFSVVNIASSLGATRAVHAADIAGGDGIPEAIFANQATGSIQWATFDGSAFTIEAALDGDASEGDQDAVSDLATTDVDGDGDLDVIATSTGEGDAGATLFVNQGAPPVLTSFFSDTTVDEDTGFSGTFTVSDSDDLLEDLTLTATSDNANLVSSVTVSGTGTERTLDVTLQPDANSDRFGPATITVTAEDLDQETATRSFVLTVTAVNDAPFITDNSDLAFSLDEGGTYTLNSSNTDLGASDVDDGPAELTYSVITAPSNGQITVNGTAAASFTEQELDNGLVAYQHDDTETETDDFVVELADGGEDGVSAVEATLSVSIILLIDPPDAFIDPPTDVTFSGATLNGRVTANDGATDAAFVLEPTDGSTAPQTITAATGLTGGTTPVPVQAAATGLQPDTEYRVFLEATNAEGTTSSSATTFATQDPLTLTPSPVDFASLGADGYRDRTITLTNALSTAQDVTRIDLLNNPGVFTRVDDLTPPFTLNGGESVSLEVRYAPTAGDGLQSATLEVESDAEVERTTLEGNALSRLALRYGRVPTGAPVPRSVPVFNPLPTAVTVEAASIAGPDAGAFALTDDPIGTSIPSGGTVDVPVAFEAGTAGTYNAVLTITTDRDQRVRDLSAQALALTVDAGREPAVGEAVPVTIGFPEAMTPTQAALFYRPAGERSYTRQALDATAGGTVETSIPGEAVTRSGVQYYVEVTDEQSEVPLTITFPAVAPARFPAGIRARISQLNAQGAVAARTYRMYSFPVDPDTTVAAVLQSDANFGPYDRSEWRAFRYPPSLAERQRDGRTVEQIQPQEFPEIEGMDRPGTAFWHVTQTGQTLSVRNALSTDPSEPVTIPLEPGWNQIGTPFPFPVAWQTILDSTRAGLTDSTARAALNQVSAPVQWDGQRYQYDRSTLRPWRGSFVYNPTPDRTVRLRVPPVRAASAGTQATSATADANTEPALAPPASTKRSAYRLHLRASTPVDGREAPLVDANNWIGLLDGAVAGVGPEDAYEAPPVGSYLRLSILRDDAPYQHLAASFKPLKGTGQTWDLEVTTRVRERFYTDKTVTLRLHEHGTRPQGYELYVIDRTERRLLPITDGRVQVPLTADTPKRDLRVIAGTKSYATAKSDGVPLRSFETALRGNYPNPFEGSTTIAFQLATQTDVRLVIYDVLGRRVRTLLDDAQRDTGPQEVTWSGTNDLGRRVASGIYVYRLEAGDVTTTGKMTLIR